MTGDRQRWLECLVAERRRRVGYQATHDDAVERLEAELEAMYQRLITVTTPPWSPGGDASIAERVAMFRRWPPGCVVDPEQEAAELERWFKEHGHPRGHSAPRRG
jgi:hypothetical protein